MTTIEEGFNEVSDEEYHADTEWITSSQLKTAADDLAIYKHRYVDGNSVQETPAISVGKLVHSLLACEVSSCDEPKPKIVTYDGVRRGKKWEEFKDDNQGASICNEKERVQTTCTFIAILSNDFVQTIISKFGRPDIVERCFAWMEYGQRQKFKPDAVFSKQKLVVDWKTTSNFSLRSIRQTIANYKYHLQAAHYLAGAARMLDCAEHECQLVFVFAETVAPYRTAVIKLDDDDLGNSFDQRRQVLAKIKHAKANSCFEENYSSEITTIKLPEYLFNE